MNKKILMSIAAAATMATVFTGCGSDSSSSDDSSTVSGVAVKANLNGAKVSMGGKTVDTAENGSFTVSGTGSTVTITGGTYSLNNVDKNNSVILKATKEQVNAGAPISMLTTLVQEFDGNVTRAANVLGVKYVEGQTNLGDIDVGDFEKAAVAIATLMEKATDLDKAMTSLKNSATTPLTLTTLATAIGTAATDANLSADDKTLVNAIATSIKNGNALGHALAMSNENNSTLTYTEASYKTNNVVDVNVTDDDATDDVVSFALTNYDANLTNANGNTSLFVSIKGTDSANQNTSYVMGITNLDVLDNSDVLTLTNSNNKAVLNTMANSNISYAVAMDTNASELYASQIFTGNDVNVSAFSDYAESLYKDSNNSTLGTFAMPEGNYSVKVYVNIDDQKMTTDGQLTDLIGSSMKQTSNNANTLFSGVQAYKIVDANLTK